MTHDMENQVSRRGVYIVADWWAMTGMLQEALQASESRRAAAKTKYDWRQMSEWLVRQADAVVGEGVGPHLGTSLIVWYLTDSRGRVQREHRSLFESAARAYALENMSTWMLPVRSFPRTCEHCGGDLTPCPNDACGRERQYRVKKKGVETAMLAELERVYHDYADCGTVILGGTLDAYVPAVEHLRSRGIRVICATTPGKAEALIASSGHPSININDHSPPLLRRKAPLATHEAVDGERGLGRRLGIHLASRQHGRLAESDGHKVGVYIDHANVVGGRGEPQHGRFVRRGASAPYVSWSGVAEELRGIASAKLGLSTTRLLSHRVHVVRSYAPLGTNAKDARAQNDKRIRWRQIMQDEQVTVDFRLRKQPEHPPACIRCGSVFEVCPKCGQSDPGKMTSFREVDVDSALTQTMLEDVYSGSVDVVILASSDTDFLPAVQAARAHGARVALACRPDSTRSELKDAANCVIEQSEEGMGPLDWSVGDGNGTQR